MGFDIECIIDIHSYPGEYFCPVCRTLVYPNEALQAQCTHLYCKPCLVHIANGTKTCPYDGYLVTESDSKPLADCDKALTEKVGKVKVHCLYFRSGCTWEGTLSDCPSHCSGCSFGNSPVICNRCGIQIVHRQVHDHAQICPGGYDGQHSAVGAAGLNKSGTTSTPVTAQVNQSAGQPGAPVPQPQNPQNVSATQLPGQNLQNANTQANANAHATMPAPDQWYQQQYQQYYQQYGGYDHYQQQQYYPLQQQPFQLHQQHSLQVQVQQQSQAYSQAQGQNQVHPLGPQPHLQLQPPQQTNHASQAAQQPHLQQQTQPLSQPHLQMLPQVQAQAQLTPQGQAQGPANAPVQALPPNYQINPQQQAQPTMRPQTQIPSQGLPPPPHSQSSQPPQFPQAVGMRPPAHPQHPLVPQYHQGQGRMHHPSQAHLQPPMHPQNRAYIQSSSLSNAPSQPQTQLYQVRSQIPVLHSQANQTAAPNTLPQAPYPLAPPASGHHSYQQPQTAQKMQPGAPQQHAGLPNPPSGSIHSVPVYGQASQQTTPIRPLHSRGSFSQQQPSAPLPLQNQVPGIPPAAHQQFLPHGQQLTHPTPHHPVIQPIQQSAPPNYPLPPQFSAPYQGEFHQQGHLPQQPLLQSQMQMRPPGPPHPQQPQNYVGIPMQSQPLSSGGFGTSGHSGPAQGDSKSNQNQNYAKSMVPEQNVTVQKIKSPSKVLVEKGFEGDSLKEVGTEPNGTLVKDANDSVKDGLVKSVIKQEKGDLMGARESANLENPFGAVGIENMACKDVIRTLSDSVPLKQADSESLMKLSKTAGLSSGNFGDETILANSRSIAEGQTLVPQSHDSHQEKSKAQPSSTVGSQGPGASPHPGQSVNLTERNGAGSLDGPPESLESLADASGLGKPPSLPFEGQFGSQRVVHLGEVAMVNHQMSGSGELRPPDKSHADGPIHLGKNGGAACEPSMLGARDVNSKDLSEEHLNLFARETTHTSDEVPRSLDKTLHVHSCDDVSKLDPGAGAEVPPQLFPHHPSGGRGDMIGPGPGPEYGHHSKPFPYHSPGMDYLGSPSRGFGGPSRFPRGTLGFEDSNYREAHRFGEASKSFNLSSDFVRNPFHDGMFPPSRRGDVDGPGNPRFGEHRVPGLLHNHIGGDDAFGPDGPGHLMKGKFSGPGYLTGHFNMRETTGHGTLSGHGRTGEAIGSFPRPPFTESVRSDMPSLLHHREPLLRNNYPYHGIPNAVQFSGGVNSFNDSRKRKPLSNGWCRICEFDCETVERLEMHSQTREHQNMAMDIVRRIKLQNKNKLRTVGGHMVYEGGSRTRKVGTVGHGNKP